jgi:hypothetical protein
MMPKHFTPYPEMEPGAAPWERKQQPRPPADQDVTMVKCSDGKWRSGKDLEEWIEERGR